MSVRTETFGHEAPHVPAVSILAVVLAFAVGITLGAMVLARDTAPASDPGAALKAALEAPRYDPAMPASAAERAIGSDPAAFQPRSFLEAAERTAGLGAVTFQPPWDAEMLQRAERGAGRAMSGGNPGGNPVTEFQPPGR